MSPIPTASRWLYAAILIALVPHVGFAQSPADEAIDRVELPDGVEGAEDADVAPVVVFDEEQQAKFDTLIDQLASGEFAKRERAAAELMDMGLDVVGPLRDRIAETQDAEVRLRAEQIVRQLTVGDMQTRINDFLAGRDVDFAGWEVIRSMLGDNGTIREMFVELTQAHPTLTASMDGSTRDRVIALEQAIATVQNRTFIERKFPTRADTFAMVLPTVDPKVPITVGYETVLLSVLQKTGASEIARNGQLAPSFRALLGRWLIRSTLSNRYEALTAGMTWDVADALPLAVATLTEANQADTLSTALQVIARFGKREHALLVLPLLEDSRPASETGEVFGDAVRTELRDVAMATIAILYDADLTELGFGDLQTHPTYGFIMGDIAYPGNDPEARAKTREKIDQLLVKADKVEGS
ncbi:hypothetical protein Poly51_07820 [Rubripirellula tenax]|uniref:HEAT repeat protein n=1 Tax=Rubripirellula tenax TaxID=2528015 RepID=A0A5C6FFC1_9BACT|nr:hypothetical protein [Rubripirellula tenax]TWU60506.1 hypothetical protein Poly51_07820 [Rubripirellula tenax]